MVWEYLKKYVLIVVLCLLFLDFFYEQILTSPWPPSIPVGRSCPWIPEVLHPSLRGFLTSILVCLGHPLCLTPDLPFLHPPFLGTRGLSCPLSQAPHDSTTCEVQSHPQPLEKLAASWPSLTDARS